MTRAVGGALRGFTAEVAQQVRIVQGTDADMAAAAINPVPIQQSPLFNPTLDYVQFLLSSVMPTVLHIFICAASVLSFSRERHTAAGIARLVRLGGSPLRAIAGKVLPYTVCGTLMLLIADMIIFAILDVPFRGSFSFHFIYSVVFVLTCQFLGALIALISSDVVGALGLAGLLVAPAFGFSGVSFPG